MSSALKIKESNLKSKKSLRAKLRTIYQFKYSYLFMLPFSIVFILFTILPVITAIYYSFTYYNILQPAKFIGLGNYQKLLFGDNIFLLSVQNTMIFAAITGPLSYLLCLMIAWFVNELSPRLRTLLTLLFYAPALAGATYIWSLIFSSDKYGYLNSWLLKLGIINLEKQWLVDSQTIKIALVIVILWSSLGVSFLTFIAGFQSMDRSIFEAGAVDGIKNRYQELWFITLPSIKGQLLFSAVMSVTASFGVGDIVTALCGFPSSGYEAHTIMNHLQDYGTIRYEMGYACAIAAILFLTMVSVNQLIQKLISKIGK